jgi:hypothetical protein
VGFRAGAVRFPALRRFWRRLSTAPRSTSAGGGRWSRISKRTSFRALTGVIPGLDPGTSIAGAALFGSRWPGQARP